MEHVGRIREARSEKRFMKTAVLDLWRVQPQQSHRRDITATRQRPVQALMPPLGRYESKGGRSMTRAPRDGDFILRATGRPGEPARPDSLGIVFARHPSAVNTSQRVPGRCKAPTRKPGRRLAKTELCCTRALRNNDGGWALTLCWQGRRREWVSLSCEGICTRGYL